MVSINPHTTRATGTILTAAIYNGDHQNHITNAQNLANAIPTITTMGADILDSANASEALDALGFTTYTKTLVDDADASTALSTLGVSTFAKTLLDDADAAAARTTLQMGWKLIMNQSFTNVTTVSVTGLGGARFIRFGMYAVPTSGAESGMGMRVSNNGGSSYDATASYGNAMDYSASGVGSGNNSAGSFPATSTAFLLAAFSAMRPSSVALLGGRHDYILSGMSAGYIVLNGNTVMYRGSGINDVIVGQQAGWKGGFSGMDAIQFFINTGNMSGDIMVEALF